MALWYYLLFTCVFYLSVSCLHTATIVTSSLMQACILAGKHNYDIIMSAMVSQIIGVSIVFSTIYWGADQRKRQSCASLASLCGNWIPRTNGQYRGKCFHLVTSSWNNMHIACFNCSDLIDSVRMEISRFSFMLSRTGCWTNSQITCDLRRNDDHVTSL